MADRRARLRRNYAWQAKCLVRALVEDGIPRAFTEGRRPARARWSGLSRSVDGENRERTVETQRSA